jgi:Domain of unknown function (DUF6379)
MRVDLLSERVGRTADGCSLRVRSPWYRSLPLSSVLVDLRIDGERVASDRLRFCVNDRDYELDELADRYDEFWFVLDVAQLRVRGVDPGTHEAALELGLRAPYLFDEETGDVLTIRTTQTRTVVVPDEAIA